MPGTGRFVPLLGCLPACGSVIGTPGHPTPPLDTAQLIMVVLADRYAITHEPGGGETSLAPSESVTVSVTHGKVWHFDASSPARDDTNSLFVCKLPEFHARLDLSLNQ